MYKDKANQIADLLDIKGNAYNSPEAFFNQLSKTWSALMIAFKSCRIVNNPGHEDSADDLVGYSLIMTELTKDEHLF
jgi:hypothetical protein